MVKAKVKFIERWNALKFAVKWTYKASKTLTIIIFIVTIQWTSGRR